MYKSVQSASNPYEDWHVSGFNDSETQISRVSLMTL